MSRPSGLARGALLNMGEARLGRFDTYQWWRCVDCGTEYPQVPFRAITCNGYAIGRCPWCSGSPHLAKARGEHLRSQSQAKAEGGKS